MRVSAFAGFNNCHTSYRLHECSGFPGMACYMQDQGVAGCDLMPVLNDVRPLSPERLTKADRDSASWVYDGDSTANDVAHV
jgi:hypothetical protein